MVETDIPEAPAPVPVADDVDPAAPVFDPPDIVVTDTPEVPAPAPAVDNVDPVMPVFDPPGTTLPLTTGTLDPIVVTPTAVAEEAAPAVESGRLLPESSDDGTSTT